MRKIWDTPGGVHPPEHKTQSLGRPLFELGLPPEIILPVSQHLGVPAKPVVSVGEKVLKGQLVAEGTEFISANIHASTSGVVTAIEDRPLPHASGFKGLCVVIQPDGADQWITLTPCSNYQDTDRSLLLEKIKNAGIVGMGGAGFPTSVKLGSPLKINTLVINGTECEPYITADDILMQLSADEIIDGVLLLDYLLAQPNEILIAIEENKPKAIAAMQAAVDAMSDSNDHFKTKKRIEIVSLPVKYPSGGEKQLIQMLTGKEIPAGKLPADVSTVCQNIATVLAAYRAVRFGEPVISRITTITGNAYKTQRNVLVRIGTPVYFILDTHGYDESKASRLVMGGPMMGFTLLDSAAPVVKTTNCLLAPSVEESPPPSPAQACIRCGMCAEACPASLLPQQLYWYARSEDEEKLKAHNLFDCIECGACSYACPSQIPLVQYYRAAKGQIKKHAIEKQQSDQARQRFEFHKERLEQEKAERLKAKEEAAEKAKQKKLEKEKNKQKLLADNSEQSKNDSTSTTTSSITTVPTTTVPTTAESVQPATNVESSRNELARLTRNFISTEEQIKKLGGRVESLKSSDPEQADGIRARIKDAELKKQTLLDKLALLSTEAATTPETNNEPVSKNIPIETLAEETPNPEGPDLKPRDEMSHEERKKHEGSIKALEDQLEKTQEKLNNTDSDDIDTQSALKMSIDILNQRLKRAKLAISDNNSTTFIDSDLSNIEKTNSEQTLTSDDTPSGDDNLRGGSALSDAIFASMEKIVAKNANNNLANDLSNQLQQKIHSLEIRLNKAKIKYSENNNKDLVSSLQDNVNKLEEKLVLSRQALKELVEQDD